MLKYFLVDLRAESEWSHKQNYHSSFWGSIPPPSTTKNSLIKFREFFVKNPPIQK